MPVEIKELVIRTEVKSIEQQVYSDVQKKDLADLKADIMKACKRMITEQTRKTSFKR